MDKTTIESGDLVQICPEHDYGGCIVVVDNVFSYGVEGFIPLPHREIYNVHRVELRWGEFELCGTAAFYNRRKIKDIKIYEKDSSCECEVYDFKSSAL